MSESLNALQRGGLPGWVWRDAGQHAWLLSILLVAVGLSAGAVETTGGEGRWHVVPVEKVQHPVVPIPPLATVTGEDNTGKTWRQNGTTPGGLDVAGKDLRDALRQGGWSVEKTIHLGSGAGRSELMIVTRGHYRVLMMVWEIEPGRCGFSWGEER